MAVFSPGERAMGRSIATTIPMTIPMGRSIGTRGPLACLSLPAVIFTGAMIAFPFAYTLWFSLREYSFGAKPRFNFGMNYFELAGDGEFWNGLRITLLLYLLSLALQLVLGTWVALLLHNARKLSGIVRTLMISPFV